MDPFDAPGPTAASRERLDRLRERTAAPPPVRARRSTVPWLVTALLLAFALGLIANPWFERRVRSQLPGFAQVTTPGADALAAQARALATLQARVAVLEARGRASSAPALVPDAAAAGAAGERLARLETRLEDAQRSDGALGPRVDALTAEVATLRGRVDATTGAMATTLDDATRAAGQAQTMLVLATVRRTLEAGGRLGLVEAELRNRLAARFPQPVEAVAALGNAPVTTAGLRSGFDQLRAGSSAPANASWWASVRSSIGSAIGGAAVPAGDAAYARAAAALRGGNVAAARDAVGALPAAERARMAGWSAAADRYLAGMRGLGALEAAAITPLPPAAAPRVVSPAGSAAAH